MISSFWTQVWSQHQDNEEAAANKLVRDFGVVDLSFTWEPVSSCPPSQRVLPGLMDGMEWKSNTLPSRLFKFSISVLLDGMNRVACLTKCRNPNRCVSLRSTRFRKTTPLRFKMFVLSAFFPFFGESIPALGSSLIRLKNGPNGTCADKVAHGTSIRIRWSSKGLSHLS